MKFGIVGLGRMGGSLALHAIEKGHEVVGYDPQAEAVSRLGSSGLQAASSIADLAQKLPSPRVVFVYVPHGVATESACRELKSALARDDVVVDGGNSHWLDSKKRHVSFAEAGIRFLDMGTSGGVSGARQGACFMAAGPRAAFDLVAPVLRDLAVDDLGVIFVGEAPGAGHFVKLIHNAIEFGMVQAIGEGVEMLERSEYKLDLPALFVNWNHGSVIRSWLVELMGRAFVENADFAPLSTYVEDTGEVKWVLEWALEQDIPSPVISLSQTALMQYRDQDTTTAKAVALMRHGYGGHPVHRIGEDGGAALPSAPVRGEP